MKKPDRFDLLDISAMQLPDDTPLDSGIIECYEELAGKVIQQALDDLDSKDEIVQRGAVRFCMSQDQTDVNARHLWLAWINMTEEALARDAKMRLMQKETGNQASKRQSRVLPKAEGLPIRRSRPTQPEGLSYRA